MTFLKKKTENISRKICQEERTIERARERQTDRQTDRQIERVR